jgi:hypothetical protein
MIRPEEPKGKKGGGIRLPRLGRASQLAIIVGIFLIIFIPLWIIYQQQPAKQTELRGTLSNLEKILAIQETPKERLESELNQAEVELEAAKDAFPNPNQSPEIIDELLKLAESNDIYVTGTRISASQRALSKTEGAIEWSILTIDISLKGQVPKFQNFLLDIDSQLSTCTVKEATFNIAQKEGEEDIASIKIEVFCYGGNE